MTRKKTQGDAAAAATDAPISMDNEKPVPATKKTAARKSSATKPSRLHGELRHSTEQIQDSFRNGTYPYKTRIRKAAYEKHKEELQVELLKVQSWVKQTGQRIVVLFEGRDAAGKGGTIKRFMEHLNPRAARSVALEKPTDRELGQWYFQRYIKHLPTAGEMVFFDRSWYNRAGVERVMVFCHQGRAGKKVHISRARSVEAVEAQPGRSGVEG